MRSEELIVLVLVPLQSEDERFQTYHSEDMSLQHIILRIRDLKHIFDLKHSPSPSSPYRTLHRAMATLGESNSESSALAGTFNRSLQFFLGYWISFLYFSRTIVLPIRPDSRGFASGGLLGFRRLLETGAHPDLTLRGGRTRNSGRRKEGGN